MRAPGAWAIDVVTSSDESVTPKLLAETKLGDHTINLARTSFYFGRETILPTGRGRMARWRKRLFGVMSRNASSATAYYGIPPNRVVELGTQVAL